MNGYFDETDARRLVAALAERNPTRRRIELEDVWALAGELWPDAVRRADARSEVRRRLGVAAELGLLTASVRLDRAGMPELPAFITLPAPPAPTRPVRHRTVWVPQLQWADGARLDDRHHEMLLAVNRWLRDGGEARPTVPVEERSVELFNDEKAISVRIGGDSLWGQGRLSLALLRCERTATPFVWEALGAGNRLLVVENQATFRSVMRALRRAPSGHPYAGVVWGQGKMAPGRIAYAADLPFAVSAIEYYGDLDAEGLEMAADTCAAAEAVGIAAVPQAALWRLLVCSAPNRAKGRLGADRVARAVSWLPEDLREGARKILEAGDRVPQERTGYEQLAADFHWTVGTRDA